MSDRDLERGRTTPYAERRTFEYAGFSLRTYTKSEARALFKRKLGLRPGDRLPVGAAIKRDDEGVTHGIES